MRAIAPGEVPPPAEQGGPLANQPYDSGELDFDVWEYLGLLVRRRWTIVAIFTLFVFTGLVTTLASTRLYTSRALVQIQPEGPNIVSFDDVQESLGAAQAYHDFYRTQYEILSSRRLAERVIDVLSLGTNTWLNGSDAKQGLTGRTKAWVAGLVGDDRLDPERAKLKEQQELIERFLEHVSVSPRRRSFLVEVAFTSPSPDLSVRVAETLATEYIDLTLDHRVEAAAQGREFIAKQLGVTKARLENSEQELQTFARGRDIYALEQEERMIHERLADLNTRITEAESERIHLESLYRQVADGDDRKPVPLIVEDSLLETLQEELTAAEVERAELRGKFTDEFPSVRAIDTRIAQIQRTIAGEEDRLIESIGAKFNAALDEEQALRAQLLDQRQVVASYEEKSIDFKILRREVDTNRNIYESLLRRMKEVEVTEAIRASNITLVDRPVTPLEPASPRVAVNLALALVLGLLTGVGVAFLQEYVDDSIRVPDEVERYLRLPTLGAVPEFAPAEKSPRDEQSTADLEVALRPTSVGAEAIRTLRASLFLAAAGGLPTRLLVTSARPSEGKTCIAVNLAAALAQMGRRIVVLDCDLRRPRVHKAIPLNQTPGMTNALTGNASVDDVIQPSGQVGLDVIAAGPIPPNPVDLLDSVRMGELIRELEDRYDHIVVDAPPSLGFADVPVLSNRLGGGCLLVTRAGVTSRRVARQACEYLIRMQSKLLGVVLNRVSANGIGYSYYGYYGYYGDPYEQTAEESAAAEDRIAKSA